MTHDEKIKFYSTLYTLKNWDKDQQGNPWLETSDLCYQDRCQFSKIPSWKFQSCTVLSPSEETKMTCFLAIWPLALMHSFFLHFLLMMGILPLCWDTCCSGLVWISLPHIHHQGASSGTCSIPLFPPITVFQFILIWIVHSHSTNHKIQQKIQSSRDTAFPSA